MIRLHSHPQFLLDLKNIKNLLWNIKDQCSSRRYQGKSSGPAQSAHINSPSSVIEEVKGWRGMRILLCLNLLTCFGSAPLVLYIIHLNTEPLHHHHHQHHDSHHHQSVNGLVNVIVTIVSMDTHIWNINIITVT